LGAKPPLKPSLSLCDVHAGYEDVSILRGVDLDLEPATITAVIGANGAGKSTLLRTIFGLTVFTRGSIVLFGEEISGLASKQRLARGVTIVPQGRCNFPLMSVRENLEMGAYTRRDRRVAGDIDEVCSTFPVLGQKRSQLAGSLSGGEQQLLEIGMSLMLSPKVMLIDEPSLGLSARMRRQVFESILALRVRGTTVLLVEQNAVQALKIADRAIVIEHGRVKYEGSGVGMLEDPEVRRAYLGSPAEFATGLGRTRA
jgi:branched-chain amino acid transport system ATP-binding protein